jgi:flagellar biosynthesis protein FliQ
MVVLAVVSGPLFLALFVVSLIIGVLQSATQIQEPAVGALPRLATVVVGLMLGGGFIVERLATFFKSAVERMAERGF